MRRKLVLTAALVTAATWSSLQAPSEASLVCETYFGCRTTRMVDAVYCTCDSYTRNCTICCDTQEAYCCSGGSCV
jgi:hypothetical protein